MNSNELAVVVKAVDAASATLNDVKGNFKDFSGSTSKDMDRAARVSQESSELTRKALTATGIALAGTGAAITAFAKNSADSTIQYVGSVNKLSREIGATVGQTSQLIYAGKRMGLSAEEASVSFGLLSKKITESRDGAAETALKQSELRNKVAATQQEVVKLTAEIAKNGDKTGELKTKIQGLNISMDQYKLQLKEAADPLAELSVQTKNADGTSRSFNEILLAVADRFKEMPNGAEKTAAAMSLFGRSGKDLLPLLNQGSKGIEALMEKADKLGLTLNASTVVSVKAYTTAQKDMNDQMQALKLRVGIETIPVMTAFQQKLNDVVSALLDTPGPIKKLTTDVLAFGGPVMAASGAALGFGANLATALPVLSKMGPAAIGAAAALGPWVLILGAVAAALGFSAYKMGMFDDILGKTNQAQATAGGSATMLALAQEHVARSTEAVRQAQESLKTAHVDVKQSTDEVTAKNVELEAQQQRVTAALNEFGENSPQYQQAVQQLTDKQTALDDAMFHQLETTTNLTIAQGDLRDKNNELSGATQNLTEIQKMLNQGIDSMVIKVAKLGPTAAMQVAPIANLLGNIDQLLGRMRGIQDIQGQADAANARLQGLGSTIDRLQAQSSTLNRSLQNASSANLQGATGTAPVKGVYQAHAAGGVFTSPHLGLVAEAGAEAIIPLTDPRRAREVMVEAGLASPKSNSGTVINQTNNIYNQVDLDEANAKLAWGLASA
ncbi:UNVERIFIED_ORG: putative nucleic acid-binding Zn-ribbon protein [Arthrobacter sp. UYEF1]